MRISNLHRPGSAAHSVILALGLGLTLFVTLALTDRTISTELHVRHSGTAPAFFFLDVRNDEIAGLPRHWSKAEPGVTAHRDGADAARPDRQAQGCRSRARSRHRPMPPGRCAAIAASPMRIALPEGSKLIAGEWWPKDYDGPPLVSFVDEVAEGLGLKIGDEVTVNVLGRDVTAKIANLRKRQLALARHQFRHGVHARRRSKARRIRSSSRSRWTAAMRRSC